MSSFVPLRNQWIVERTFAWLLRCRRLSRDYEALPESSEAWMRLAVIALMLRRLCPSSAPRNTEPRSEVEIHFQAGTDFREEVVAGSGLNVGVDYQSQELAKRKR